MDGLLLQSHRAGCVLTGVISSGNGSSCTILPTLRRLYNLTRKYEQGTSKAGYGCTILTSHWTKWIFLKKINLDYSDVIAGFAGRSCLHHKERGDKSCWNTKTPSFASRHKI